MSCGTWFTSRSTSLVVGRPLTLFGGLSSDAAGWVPKVSPQVRAASSVRSRTVYRILPVRRRRPGHGRACAVLHGLLSAAGAVTWRRTSATAPTAAQRRGRTPRG